MPEPIDPDPIDPDPIDPDPWSRPLGALVRGDEVEFRVWAPRAERVEVVLDGGRALALSPEPHGFFAGTTPARPGERYELRLDGGERRPDPCSRFQPEGVLGPSEIVDPGAFSFAESPPELRLDELVVLELHVGTFSEEGTFDGVIPHLAALRELGVAAIELMPIATFPGRRGWGYDGLYLWAPHPAYGGPAGLARLVDAAHAAGLCVLLDVVYNHVGPGAEALAAFGPYFTDRYSTLWGDAVNYDGPESDAVRAFAIQNACMWVRDFRIDGLRLDAVHAIYDTSPRHVIDELAEAVHRARPGALVIAESALNDAKVIRPRERCGWGLDAQWADDFHHALHALLTGERDGYYADFGRVADLARAFHRPFVRDGTWSAHARRRLGAPAEDRLPEQFVVFAQNHDQVGNRAKGDRLPPALHPLALLCTLLAPYAPLLFMGEEYGERRPFPFFADHIDPEIARLTREGRRREFESFGGFSGEVPDPQLPSTFEAAKLDRSAADEGTQSLVRHLLGLRGRLPREVAGVVADEAAGSLLVSMPPFTLVCNFGDDPLALPAEDSVVAASTHDGVALIEGTLHVPARAGALLEEVADGGE